MKHDDIKSIYTKEEYIGKKITVCGWVRTIRRSKNMCFVEINDGTSLKNLQLVIDNDNLINFEFFNKLSVGASIAVRGTLVNSLNQNQKFELNVEEAKLIGDCPRDYPIQKKNKILSI